MSGGNQVGQIGGQASADATQLGNLSIEAMANRYQQLGLGATPAMPVGTAQGAVPTSGGTSFRPGGGTTGGAGASGGWGVNPGSGTTPTTGGSFGAGPTAFQMESGALPGWTSIPEEFKAALGEAQFQDLGQTASAAAGSAQAKGQTFSGITSAIGALGV